MMNPLLLRAVMLHAITLLLFVGMSSCIFTPEVDPGSVDLFTDDASAKLSDLNNVILTCPWEVGNKTPAKVTVEKISWYGTVNGKSPFSGSINPAILALAGIDTADVLTITANVSPDKTDSPEDPPSGVTFEVEATFVISGANGIEEFVAEWSGEYLQSRIPQVTVVPSVAHVGNDLELHMEIQVHNSNPFRVKLDRVSYRLSVLGTLLGGRAVGIGQVIRKATGVQFEIEEVLRGKEHKEVWKELKTRGNIPYHLEVIVEIDGGFHLRERSGVINFSLH